MVKSSFQNNYSEMYMIPPDIYKKMLNCITEDEKQNVQRINELSDQSVAKNQGLTSIPNTTNNETRINDTLQEPVVESEKELSQVSDNEENSSIKDHEEEVNQVEKELKENEQISPSKIDQNSNRPVAHLRPVDPTKTPQENSILYLQKELLNCRKSLAELEKRISNNNDNNTGSKTKITPNIRFLEESDDSDDDVNPLPDDDVEMSQIKSPSKSQTEKNDYVTFPTTVRRSLRVAGQPYIPYNKTKIIGLPGNIKKSTKLKTKKNDAESSPKDGTQPFVKPLTRRQRKNLKNKNKRVSQEDGTEYLEEEGKRLKLRDKSDVNEMDEEDI